MAKKYVDAVFRKMNEIDHFVTYQQLPTQYISDGEKKILFVCSLPQGVLTKSDIFDIEIQYTLLQFIRGV